MGSRSFSWPSTSSWLPGRLGPTDYSGQGVGFQPSVAGVRGSHEGVPNSGDSRQHRPPCAVGGPCLCHALTGYLLSLLLSGLLSIDRVGC